ncbi:hypothetical protein V1502_09710 [Bacillus sp. SCS-153A]
MWSWMESEYPKSLNEVVDCGVERNRSIQRGSKRLSIVGLDGIGVTKEAE